MIDIHSHILGQIDDGAQNLEESIAIVESAIKNGVTDIFLTPHYIMDSKFQKNNSEKKSLFNELKQKFKNRINFHLGNEIYINNQIVKLIKNDEISFLGNSSYLLIELPIINEFPNLAKYLFELQSKGCRIIIAHPERYDYFIKDFNKVISLCRQGIYFQGSYMSLYGVYGKEVKNMFQKLVKHECYAFMASDVHRSKDNFYDKIDDAYHKVAKLSSKEYAEKVFKLNGLELIKNKKIENNIKEKTNLFKRIRGKI